MTRFRNTYGGSYVVWPIVVKERISGFGTNFFWFNQFPNCTEVRYHSVYYEDASEEYIF
ncbi:uncharacterized protein METZ01_LOCUS329763 [marine metagenome]|uniref:Uncharacterized protein n=1 Tax=marine metagenome TaxID=408172 RepID=A0A382PU98_9ZZZZ